MVRMLEYAFNLHDMEGQQQLCPLYTGYYNYILRVRTTE
jgi:hypothetical protein